MENAILSCEQIQQIKVALAASDDRSLKLLVHLGLYAGLRAAEAASLRRADVTDPDGRIAEHVRVRTSKSGALRAVPMHANLRGELEAALKTDEGRVGGTLFDDARGAPLSPYAVRMKIRALFRRIGLGGFSPHSLRKTFCARQRGL
jgi:integrase